jgi:hypothetical protein
VRVAALEQKVDLRFNELDTRLDRRFEAADRKTDALDRKIDMKCGLFLAEMRTNHASILHSLDLDRR